MAIRDQYPRVQFPRSHYFISFARGEGIRTFALRPLALWMLLALGPVCAIWGGAVTAYVAFHDDMVGFYLAREADMQNAYEDRLADARAQLDRVASRQLLDQTSFEGKMHDLLSRQARLEQRGSLVAALASQAVAAESAAAALDAAPRHARAAPTALNAIESVSRNGPSDSDISTAARAYAPVAAPAAASKPHPIDEPGERAAPKSLSQRAPVDKAAADLAAAANNPDLDAQARLGLIGYSIDRVDRSQVAALNEITVAARSQSAKMAAVVARTGLSIDALAPQAPRGGVGGPFIPMADDPGSSAFDKAAAKAAREVEQADRLRRLMPYLPIREPLFGDAGVSSPFGYRPDPFLGKPALHPGVDLVQSYGAEIRATAAGKVVHAGPMGGYGNMVEIDHGNGIATRYGHMSEVLVEEGAEVKSGTVIGKIGSTGRSTGPHLHYEVRVDGEPVDPERFLQATSRVASE